MRKMILVFVVLLLAVPAVAEVKITCEQTLLRGSIPSECNIITVYYNATSEANLPRALALDITLSDTGTIGGAAIMSVTPAVIGESNSVGGRGYGIFLGSDGIDINSTTGVPDGFGSPVANPGDSGAATGLGTNAVTVELASLYPGTQGPANPDSPIKSGVLCTFRVNDKICNVVITENTTRGGIVMENPAQAVDVNLPGVGATAAFAILCPADMVGRRDAPPDGKVSIYDFQLLSGNYPPLPMTDSRADICGRRNAPPDGVVSIYDFQMLSRNYWRDWN